MTGSEVPPSFRLAYVPGVIPGKWVRIWHERLPDIPLDLIQATAAEAPDMLRRRDADAGFVRLPFDRTDLSAIPLYTETTVVVIPKDHIVSAADEVSPADLADDVVFHPLDETLEWDVRPGRPAIERPATTADAVELVAAGVGLLVVPQSLARLHHRKDLTYRPVTDAPQSRVALSWREDATTDMVEDFIGIVRGRTVNSTRGRRPAAPEPQKKKRPETGTGTRHKPAAGKNPRRGSGGVKGGKPRRRS
ncbi:LysR family substrate-binding domain-containing protein [Streptomyces silvisoli]|uniref:LysR family substrate-binding domain-containing protein n=1 Tax=Streptomyces silvisoli TaxID=3034235 RepID=A0ABT5ZNJ3_9ACTN|nr:LysR family substrate-binding domain-containing protein [Streptomyces silvisoli]MDF3290573.1 LysR family substrate-binding domain-containing protein [Streptomyces silvisoli]